MIKIIVFLSFLTFFSNAKAEIMPQDFGYKNCNHHKFTFLLLKAYDAYLCVNENDYLEPKKIYETDFSLIINYNMNFKKEELSKSSIEEINRYYNVKEKDQKSYYNKLMKIFPNVRKGDIIEAKYNKNGFVSFYHNKLFTGKIDEAKFSKIFLDIWLYKDNKYQEMIKDLFSKK